MKTYHGLDAAGRHLHIGALSATHGWETMNSLPLPGIDHVCNARDLSGFPDNTFDTLYASHLLEHFDYRDEISAVLAEWFRVLAPGGRILVSVPDMDTICRMYCDRIRFDENDRFILMRMIMGGHSDSYDYHYAAMNEDLLVHYLSEAGFKGMCRKEDFGLFQDTSIYRFKGELISLNISAEKPLTAIHDPSSASTLNSVPGTDHEDGVRHVSFSITRNGSTYPFEYLFDTGQPTQRNLAAHILTKTLYEPEVSLVLMQILQGGDSFVDVGANVGFYTVIAARLVGPTGKVYAFEPEASNFQRLAQNISLNSLTNVELIEAAVGDHNSQTELYINSDNDGGHALWNPGAHSFNQRSREKVILQKTQMITLDFALGNHPESCRGIKAVKIDVEGFEQQVLTGAAEMILRNRIPFILAEINRFGLKQVGADELTVRRLMHHLGYIAYLAEVAEAGSSIHFIEMPLHFIPSPDNPETVYNIVFCLPGEPERYGFQILWCV